MPIEISMPKLSDTMEEGTLLKWRIKEGDEVRKGQIIAEVETDKASMEMEAFEEGTVTALKVEEGETVSVGTVLALLGETGETAVEAKEKAVKTKEEGEKKEKRRLDEETEAGSEREKKAEEEEKESPTPEERESRPAKKEPEADAEAEGREPDFAASPAARRLAREKGVDLGRIRGTGPGGRIVLVDVERARLTEAAKAPKPAAPAVTEPGEQRSSASGKSVKIRRIVARKMVESWQTIPHFFVTVAVDMTDVIRFRQELEVTINDFILAAVARSLGEHPWVNSLWVDGEAVEQEEISIAMAVATERGLYNPVLKDCGHLSLKEISRRARVIGEHAHRGKLRAEEMEGATFTISNMGMLGVETFSAIITPPQAAVLAVGTVKAELVVDEHGAPVIAPMLRLTLSADHRVLDGADAADFLTTLKSYLEAPVTLVTCRSE